MTSALPLDPDTPARLELALPENVTAGYAWAVDEEHGAVEVEDHGHQEDAGGRGAGLVGASGTRRLTLSFTGAGRVVLGYRRAWEPRHAAPARQHVVEVV